MYRPFAMSFRAPLLVSLLLLGAWVRAAPKPLSCISFMEDDRSLADYPDDSTEYPVMFDVEHSLSSAAESGGGVAPSTHRRICQSDYTFCFALWRQSENGTHIEKQGCWKESTERNATCSHTECSSSSPTSRNNSLYYCCCSGDACNGNVSVVEPTPLQLAKASLVHFPASAAEQRLFLSGKQSDYLWHIVLVLCSVLAASLLLSVLATFFYCRSAREKSVPDEAPLAPSGPGYSSNLRNVDNLSLVGLLGSGKYGTVMKGVLHNQEVAVKIFPEIHHQYYINERNIYSLPLMDCPSLLQYFGYDEHHTMEGKIEYQLVLALAAQGCLQDWLIANKMDFETFYGIAKSVTRGLSHLHTELRRGDLAKPCIVHRDLNTRNILVKADGTCCIADFGFALKVFGSKYEYKGEVAMAETKSINEVGTLRYMAPELLEGAVNLRDCETSLKQMDVYALGLVLWEVATRCTDFYLPAKTTPPYTAPYELEVGTHPSFDQMQTLVVRHKARPLFPAGWGGGAAAKLVKDTCEDCWDHDAEARLTSLCAEERMQEVAGLRPRVFSLHDQSASPILSTENNLGGGGGVRTDANQHHLVPVAESCYLETIMLNSPPNKQIATRCYNAQNGQVVNGPPATLTEKNHIVYTQQQQQLQPYQGRNPSQERNLAPVSTRQPPSLVQKSKKHSFQSGQENSFSCLEDDVSVEDLISTESSTKKFVSLAPDNSNMGQGFPKQHNTDKKLRGWHGVRALIQKKLFRKDTNRDVFQRLGNGDEKSNLMDHRNAGAAERDGVFNAQLPAKAATISFIDDRQRSPNGVTTTRTTTFDGVYSCMRRPNNLDLMNAHNALPPPPPTQIVDCTKAPQIDANGVAYAGAARQQQPLQTSSGQNDVTAEQVQTPPLTQPPANRAPLRHHHKSNSVGRAELGAATCAAERAAASVDRQLRRQRSLEVFREVFSGRGSTERFRDPSQRVKTPGDVPPSVRKVRASKTLSLYDDRIMDSSTLNIL